MSVSPQFPLLLAFAVSAGCVFQSLDEAADTERGSGSGEVVGETTDFETMTGPSGTPATTASTATTVEPNTGDEGSSTSADPGPESEADGEGTAAGRSSGLCCRPNGTPGCEDMPDAEACVCALDSHCCDVAWDSYCVELGLLNECMACGEDQTIPTRPGDCCGPTMSPGCTNPDIEACVCGEDPFCCEVSWDPACVDLIEVHACGCGFGPFTDDSAGTSEVGSSGGEDQQGDCCAATLVAGCLDPVVEACVCESDPFCCDAAWDNLCVSEVAEYGCGACTYALGEGECCVANGDQGCNDQAVQDCVCAYNPQCCTQSWDETCAAEVEFFECGVCGETGTDGMPPAMTTGTSSTGS